MTNLEMEFFEEFKSVDSICKDIFQSQQGVTEYIKQMEVNFIRGSRSVSSWNEKYKMLKHLRWLRNQIAHDNGAPELMESDLVELKNFHKQLLNQEDPLAIIFKAIRESQKKPPKMRTDYSSVNAHKQNEGINPLLIVVIIAIAAILGVVFWNFLI